MTTPGLLYHTKQVGYLYKKFTFANTTAVALELGYIPPYSAVLRGGVLVIEAFNYGTNNLLDIGTAADDDGFATNLALGTIGVIVADEMATTNDFYVTAATQITCTPDITGTAGTTGIAIAWVEFLHFHSLRDAA